MYVERPSKSEQGKGRSSLSQYRRLYSYHRLLFSSMEYTVSCNMVNILFVLYPQRDHQRNERGTEEREDLFVPDWWQ